MPLPPPILLGSPGSAPVTLRAPNARDDAAHGYAVGDRWLRLDTQQQWTATSVTNGAAVWTAVTPSLALPCDSPAATACYGAVLLVTAYAGKAFQVTRASDSTTLDIGFIANTLPNFPSQLMVADFASAIAFCASTTGTITKIYDQSGNGFDLTPPLAANAPPVNSPTLKVNGLSGLDFNGGPEGAVTITRVMRNTSVQFTANAFSGFLVALQGGSLSRSSYWMLGATDQFGMFNEGQQTHVGLRTYGSAVNDVQSLIPETSPSITGIISGAGGSPTWYSNDRTGGITQGTTGAFSATAMTGLKLGLSDATLPGIWTMMAAVFYNSALTAGQKTTFDQAMYPLVGIAPQIRDTVVQIGDSISCGQLAAPVTYAGYANNAIQQMTRPIRWFNVGQPGGGWANGALIAQLTNVVNFGSSLFPAGARNIAIVGGGTNDMISGIAPATIYAIWAAAVETLKGYSGAKVYASTVLPRGAGFVSGQTKAQFDIDRQALNVLYRANASISGIFDLGADPVMGLLATVDNVAYYLDAVHPATSLGSPILAVDMLDGLRAALR